MMSLTHKNDLVVEEYYKEDLNYQSHFDKWENSIHSAIKPKFTYAHDHMTAIFPEGYYPVQGDLLLYRPSNAAQDEVLKFSLIDTNLYRVHMPNLSSGFWKAKLNWKYKEKNYYSESNFVKEK